MGDVGGVKGGGTGVGGSTYSELKPIGIVGDAEKNLAEVAKRLGVSEQALLDANPQIKDPTKISHGQILNLPQDDSPRSAVPIENAPPKTFEADSRMRLSERNFEGSMMRADLDKKMPTLQNPTPQDPVEQIKLQAFIGESPDKIGKQIAERAKWDVVTARKMLDSLSTIQGFDQTEVAAQLAKNLNDSDMKKLINKPEGRQFLDRIENQMMDGNVEPAHETQINRIRDARLSGTMTPQERGKLLLNYSMGPGPFKDQWLGKQIASEIAKNPSAGIQTANEVLSNALPSDKTTIATRTTENLNHQTLKQLAKTTDGKNFLQSMSKELTVYPGIKNPQGNRIESAEIAANLEANPVFGRLSEPTRRNISAAIERTQLRPDISKEIASLATTPGFEKLSEATRNELVESMVNKGGDEKYAAMLRTLAGDTEFQGLNDTASAGVVKNLSRFTENHDYKNMSEIDKTRSLNIMANFSLHVASDPTNVTATNTLRHMTEGTIAIKLYEKTGTTVSGFMDDGILNINVAHPDNVAASNGLDRTGRKEIVDTAAHELNHLLNSGSTSGTSERFLDEYRAFYTGFVAKGENPPSASTLKGITKHLAAKAPGGSSYDPLRELYKKDPDFKRVVDKMLSDLNQTPPKITTPEDLRTELLRLPGGYRSKYLTKIPNLDNHY